MRNLMQAIKPYLSAMPLDERYLLKKNIDNGMFTVNMDSFPTLYFRKSTTDARVFNQIFYWKEYDFIDESYVPGTVLDCGANIGMFAVWAKRRYPNARVVSVEPSPGNFEMLKLNTQEYKDMVLLNNGIWDKETHLEIKSDGGGEWMFYTVELQEPTKDSISAISIEQIMREHNIKEIDLLKIDIESAEKEVFEGNADAWLPHVKVLLIELHDRMKKGCTKAVFNALAKYDYHMEISGENIVFFFNSYKGVINK